MRTNLTLNLSVHALLHLSEVLVSLLRHQIQGTQWLHLCLHWPPQRITGINSSTFRASFSLLRCIAQHPQLKEGKLILVLSLYRCQSIGSWLQGTTAWQRNTLKATCSWHRNAKQRENQARGEEIDPSRPHSLWPTPQITYSSKLSSA